MESSPSPLRRPGPRAGEIVGNVGTTSGTAVPDGIVTVTDAYGRQVGRTGVDPYGRFALRGLPPGTYTAVATSSGFRPDATLVVLNGSGAAHHFALAGDGTVRGTVRGAGGRPLDGAVVLATDAGGRVVGSSHTRADGRFALVGLPLGPTTVTASAAAHLPAAAAVRIGPDPVAGLDVALLPAVTDLSGTVTSADGVPLPGAAVIARDASGTLVATVTTDAYGTYTLSGLEPGSYTVAATAKAALQVQLAAGGPARADLQVGIPQSAHRYRDA